MSRPLVDALKTALAGRPLPLIGDADGRLCPGASLWTAGRTWAAWLQQSGLRPGDRLAVSLPNGRLFVVLLLACLRTGVVFCPLPERLADGERQRRLQALDPALVIGLPSGVLVDPTAIEPPAPVCRPATVTSGQDLAVILWSSGTAGTARAIGLNESNLLAQASAHLPLLGLGPESRLVSYLPWSHCFGLGIELLPALLAGAEIHAVPDGGRHPASLIAAAGRHRPTHLATVPRVLEHLLDDDAGARLLAGLQGGVVGGACLQPALASRLMAAGLPLRQGYGQTECAAGVSLGAPGDFRPGLIGRPVGCELRRDAAGELWVRGPNVHAATWWGPEARREGDWLSTGDLADQDASGDWHWQGRRDACFKLSNGYMVNPRTVEAAVLALAPEAVEVVAVGTGELRVSPLVRLRPGTTLATRDWALGAWVAPPEAVAESLWRRAEGPSGKVRRPTLETLWRHSREAGA